MPNAVPNDRLVNNSDLYVPLLRYYRQGATSTGGASAPGAGQQRENAFFGRQVTANLRSTSEAVRASSANQGQPFPPELRSRTLASVHAASGGDDFVFMSQSVQTKLNDFHLRANNLRHISDSIENKVKPQGLRTSWAQPATQQLSQIKQGADLVMQSLKAGSEQVDRGDLISLAMFDTDIQEFSRALDVYTAQLIELNNSL